MLSVFTVYPDEYTFLNIKHNSPQLSYIIVECPGLTSTNIHDG